LLPRDLEDITTTPSPTVESTPSPAAESEQPQATALRSPEAAGNQVEPQYSEAAESQTPPQPSATAESRTQSQPAAEVKPPGEAKPSGLANPQAEMQPPGPTALVQTGSFKDRENAEYMVRDLKASGFEAEVVEKQIGGTLYYRVVIGPLMTLEQAQSLLMKLKDSSYEGVLLFPE
jgi:cell division septation protein DedD